MNSIVAFLLGLWFGSVVAFILYCLISKEMTEDHHHDHE